MDLFAGCGGLTLGLAEAVHIYGLKLQIDLAVDFEEAATAVYKANFPEAIVSTQAVEKHFDGLIGEPLTSVELALRAEIGSPDFLLGGPPCQGHSNLNNHTRRKDPKNKLYLLMARAAEVLRPKYVIIENVPSVRRDTAGVVENTISHLESLGYDVASATVGLNALGVAQKRKRHVVLASLHGDLDSTSILSNLTERSPETSWDLTWAIADLENIDVRNGYDALPNANATNRSRINYLFENDAYDLPNDQRPLCHQDGQHSYKSMYGRLRWDQPAQTITSGFGSIGQGRYVHPGSRRALTAHEAARIQGFPDYFSFSSVLRRGDLSTMIGNAVPPALMLELGKLLVPRTIALDDEIDAGEAA